MNDVHGNDMALHVNHSHPSMIVWWDASPWSKHLDKLNSFDVDIRAMWPIFYRKAIAYKSQVS